MLIKIFGTEREDVLEDETKLHIDEIRDFYCSPNIIQVIKKDAMGGAWDTHGRGENMKERGKILKQDGRAWGRFHVACGMWLGMEHVAGRYKHFNKTAGSIKYGQFLE
jgi:hypothetical protein